MIFSVIVPVYNVENYIVKCIDSIIYQTWKGSYEIIIVDDGCTDRTMDILNDYLSSVEVPNIQIIHQKNAGQGAARNTGISTAVGEYLLFVDSDDYIDKWTLEVLYDIIDCYSADVVRFNARTVFENGKYGKDMFYQKETVKYLDIKALVISEPSPCNKLFRKSLFLDNNIQFPSKMFYEDFGTIPLVAPYSLKIVSLNRPLYFYLQRANSTMHQKKDLKRFDDIFYMADRLIEFYRKNGFYNKYYSELEFLCIEHVLYYNTIRLINARANYKRINQIYSFMTDRFGYYLDNKYIHSNVNANMNTKILNALAQEKKMWYVKVLYIIERVQNKVSHILKVGEKYDS